MDTQQATTLVEFLGGPCDGRIEFLDIEGCDAVAVPFVNGCPLYDLIYDLIERDGRTVATFSHRQARNNAR